MVSAAVAAALLALVRSSPPSQPSEPERGTVCPYLRQAFDRLEAGDEAGFKQAVAVAAREAEQTLQKSGELFGRPEELALRLRAALAHPEEGSPRALVAAARRACDQLGRE